MSGSQHKLGWPMIAMLGVSIVIAGQFSGWNLGLAYGWKNMLVGTVIMFGFYIGFLQLVSEMGSTWPSAGGLAKFSTLAFGRLPGGLVNVSMAIALIAGTGIVSEFISAYGESLLGLDSTLIKVLLFSAVLCLHLYGTKESMWVILIAGLIAVITLLIFSGVSLAHLDIRKLADDGSLSFHGVVQALPYALWMFVGVEQAVTASEDARNPTRDIPMGLTLAIVVLVVTAAGVLVGAPSLAGADALQSAGDPLLAALDVGGYSGLHTVIGLGAIFGLIASFFSLSYSASRQLFDLSRSQFFPSMFAQSTAKGIPARALWLVMAVGFGISFAPAESILLAMVVLFTGAYAVTTLAYLRLHRKEGATYRAYTAKGGVVCGYATLGLSATIFYACFSTDMTTIFAFIVIFAAIIMYHLQARKTFPASLRSPSSS